jgi:hypothetical protein
MPKGRITRIERERRLKLLLEFVFTFRFATKKQLLYFTQNVIKLSYSRWLVENAQNQGYLKVCHIPNFKLNIYSLTEEAKALIYEQESLIDHYYFDTRYTSINTLFKHDIQVETYFLLYKYFDINIQNFLCDWALKAGRKYYYEKEPDALAIIPHGPKLAIEIENSYPEIAYCKRLIDLYRYNIEKTQKYDAVLFITPDMNRCEGLGKRLLYLNSEFCKKAIILSDLHTLRLGGCFYRGTSKDLADLPNLIKTQEVDK